MTTQEINTMPTQPDTRDQDKTRPLQTTARPRPMETGMDSDMDQHAHIEDTRDDAPSYLRQEAEAEMNERWRKVQTEFVDDPRQSVSHAHELVSDAVQRIVDTFTQERNALEQQWSEGKDVSTEDLRVCLQRYRTFFNRLLPLDKRS